MFLLRVVLFSFVHIYFPSLLALCGFFFSTPIIYIWVEWRLLGHLLGVSCAISTASSRCIPLDFRALLPSLS